MFNYKYIKDLQINTSICELYKDEKIIRFLQLFNFLPFTFRKEDNDFNNNIFNFLNSEFLQILYNTSKFFDKKNIFHISNLVNSNIINNINIKNNDIVKDQKKYISIKDFIKNIHYIPLKYITYSIEKKDKIVYLDYDFNYVKYPLELQINNIMARINFKSSIEPPFKKGGNFEDLINYQLLTQKTLFETDGFIFVDKIINMKLLKEFQLINLNELKNKNCIFISQMEHSGIDYDFAIIYPQKKEIILLQAKYKITSQNVHDKSYYSIEKISLITFAVKEQLDLIVDKFYILYISSAEFNDSNTYKILKNKKINCIFYNISENYFSWNLKDKIFYIEPAPTFQLFVDPKEYIPQEYKTKNVLLDFALSVCKNQQNDKSIYSHDILDKEYSKFINYLETKQLRNDIKKHLGEFCYKSNNFSFFPYIYFKMYFLYFKLTEKYEINYSDLILVYEENKIMKYYDLSKDKFLKDLNKKNPLFYKDYNFMIGKWIDDNTIKLDEKEET